MFGLGALAGGGGGFSGSSSANSSTGAVSTGGFVFSPKSSTLPPIAWVAIAVGLYFFLKRR